MKIQIKKSMWVAVGMALGASLASAGTISYTCDPTVAAATCTYLNTVVASAYSGTFTNASASIYIQYGTTGLASTSAFNNDVSYADYVAALAANPSMDALQVSALASLGANDAGPYGSGNVGVKPALLEALGIAGDAIGGLTGTTASGAACNYPSVGCYDAVITVTNDPGTPLYYDNLGGIEPSDAYDFYATVEHETDEVLGTSSCITTGTTPLSDGCTYGSDGEPSAVDLFRYSAPGSLVLDSSLTTTPGAYFSYDGGTTNGVVGVGGSPKLYNTLDNGEDYADFLSSSPDCGTNQAVQDAEGCPGEDAGLNILNDGGGEINILNAVGYDLAPISTSTVPEPGTVVLFGLGLVALGAYRRRRRA